ncbi:MAG: VCBS repeat-containing protein [Pirellulales bacterium]
MRFARVLAGLLCFFLGVVVVMCVGIDFQVEKAEVSLWVKLANLLFLLFLGALPAYGGALVVRHALRDNTLVDRAQSERVPFISKHPWLVLGISLALSGTGSWWKLHQPDVPLEMKPQGILSFEKQQEIWDAEHVTFELETFFTTKFTQLLAKREAKRLTHFFRDEFQGKVLQHLDEKTRGHSIVSEVRYSRDLDQLRSVEVEEFVAFLLDSIKDFQTIERNRLRILKINRMAGDRDLWLVELLFTQHGRDNDGHLLDLESRHRAQLRFSGDQEIALGKIVTSWVVESVIVRNSAAALMKEITQQVGLADIPFKDNWTEPTDIDPHRYQIAVEDFDRDGFLDVAIASVERAWLLRSVAGNKFVDVTTLLLPEKVRHPRPPEWGMPVWIDYDNDSYPDLLLGRYLFHNDQGQKFNDVTKWSGIELPSMPMGCAVADYDCDGRLDFYVVYQQDVAREALEGSLTKPAPWVGDEHSGSKNRLWHNEGNGRFRDVTALAGVGGKADHTFAAVWFYFDSDRFPDLYVVNDFGKNMLLKNRGNGTFEDVSTQFGVDDFATSMGAVAGDLDNDGTVELYVANMYSKMGRRIIAHVGESDYPAGIFPQIEGSCAGNRLYHWTNDDNIFRDLSVELEVNEVGWAYGSTMADFDGDGWLDIYATTGYLSFHRRKPDG